MPVVLAHTQWGESGRPLVILHGMLGSSRNWTATGVLLGERFRVYALDMRNHGKSPHAEVMDYDAMADDILCWLDKEGIESAIIIGHSMGGKAAMRFACLYPERVDGLCVVDIMPKPYRALEDEFCAMDRLELHSLRSRAEAEAALSESIKDLGLRRFLLTNVRIGGEGKLEWIINYPVLRASLNTIAADPLQEDDRFEGPTAFIGGALSDFISEDDMEKALRHFPLASYESLEGAGHNVHVERKDEFVAAVAAFCEQI